MNNMQKDSYEILDFNNLRSRNRQLVVNLLEFLTSARTRTTLS
jgi:hypothetical protein